jgi:hypothetical protein
VAFLHRAERKVYQTATVSFKSNRYSVPAYLRGKRVELRFDPFDLNRIEVWYNDTFLELAEPEEVVTSTHPDVEPDPIPKPPPDSGLDYGWSLTSLALLRMERERLLQEQLGAINFTQLDQTDPKEISDDCSE